MSEDNAPEKDFKGDDVINYKSDWAEIRKSQFTYVFNYYDEKLKHYFPHFRLFTSMDDEMELAKQDPEYFERKLYKMPEKPPFDIHIRHYNFQLALLVEYFKEVFEERAFQYGHHPEHKYFNVILPKSKHEEIMICIREFKLLPITDLLFEVISIAQYNYVEHIAFWEQPEMQKLVSSAEKETQKAISVLDKFDKKDREHFTAKSKPLPDLLHINFVFADGTIKIEHSWLAKEYIKHFKNHYDNLLYKNWRLDLARYPDQFEDNYKKQQFKYNLAKSLYNLFTVTKFFPVTTSNPTPNRLMLCIAKILEFCLIPVAGEGELDENKIKTIRNWLKRNELKTETNFAEITPDKERLLKYFEPEFVNVTDKIKRVDAINLGYFIGKRFKIENLTPDLIHIAQALREVNSHIGHQMFMGGDIKRETFDEFDNFKTLVKGVRSKKKVTSIKFKLEGDDKEYELQQRLPLHIIEEAIKEYSENQQVEVDTDLIKTKVTRTGEGSFSIEKGKQFAQPNERFMVRFVKAFYDYLLKEAPMGENHSFPSLKYYPIIAIMLKQSWLFYHLRDSEEFVIAKVKQWHKLSHTA